MKISIFGISLGLIIIGIVWIGIITVQSDKMSEFFNLRATQTEVYEIYLNGEDVGFYKVSVPELGESVFTQILSPQGNIISDKKLDTKLAINYFDIKESGIYKIKITNLNEHPLIVEVEIGQTNISELRNPGIILMLGVALMALIGFKKLKNYSTAQPDEKIS